MKPKEILLRKIIKEEFMNVAIEKMIKEEAGKVNLDLDDKAERELKKTIEALINKFDELDLSIDYLAAVMSGMDTAGIGAGQKALGRSFGSRKAGEKKPEVVRRTTSKEPG